MHFSFYLPTDFALSLRHAQEMYKMYMYKIDSHLKYKLSAQYHDFLILTLTVLVTTMMHCNTLKQDNDSTVRGDGEVALARYEPALLPPCPSIRVLSYRNCQEIHSRQQTGLAV